MRVQINGISHRGEGVGRIDGKAIFIPLAIPGEDVEVKITEERSRFLRGELMEVLHSSPDRVEPECPHFTTCGGCHFQHINYSRQLELKQQIVADNLYRIGRIKTQVAPVIPSPLIWRYRNKVTWHIRGNKLGYFREGSNDLLPIHTCKLISAGLQQTSDQLRSLLADIDEDFSAEVSIRESHLTGERMLTINGSYSIPQDWHKLQAVCENAALIKEGNTKILWGSDRLAEHLGSRKYELSPGSFFQVNHAQAERIVQCLHEMLSTDTQMSLLDLYCGVGALTLNLAGYHRHVTGIEAYGPALEDARRNARLNQIYNTDYYQGACEKVLPELEDSFEGVIMDPPRAGCAPEVVEEVVKLKPEKIAYVSCNPGTLARDLGRFGQQGYIPTLVQPIDMFPQTYHVETVVLITKVKD